jgi:predicted molibdopterin-dependent oxidoreductase YjgC
LLPAKTRYEQDGGGTETTTERRILFGPELPREVGEARSEWRIFLELAAAAAPETAGILGCQSGQAIREEIARVVPAYEGIQRLRKIGDSVQYGGARLCEGGRFATSDGKAHFRAVALPETPGESDAVNAFKVSTRRGKQFNSLVYAERDPLNGARRDSVLMSRDDAARLGLSQHDPVVLISETGRMECRVFLAPIAPGNLQVHWPEGNAIIARGRIDAIGGVPDYNARVRVERLTAAAVPDPSGPAL